MGHILPILGKDWSHSGVAQLYQNIKANGYNILYLTSRPIGSVNQFYFFFFQKGNIFFRLILQKDTLKD